jgi:hypothetical protein
MTLDQIVAMLPTMRADVLRQQYALDDCDYHDNGDCLAHLSFEDAASFLQQAHDSLEEGLADIARADAQRQPLDPDALRDRRDERWRAEIDRLEAMLEAAE